MKERIKLRRCLQVFRRLVHYHGGEYVSRQEDMVLRVGAGNSP